MVVERVSDRGKSVGGEEPGCGGAVPFQERADQFSGARGKGGGVGRGGGNGGRGAGARDGLSVRKRGGVGRGAAAVGEPDEHIGNSAHCRADNDHAVLPGGSCNYVQHAGDICGVRYRRTSELQRFHFLTILAPNALRRFSISS